MSGSGVRVCKAAQMLCGVRTGAGGYGGGEEARPACPLETRPPPSTDLSRIDLWLRAWKSGSRSKKLSMLLRSGGRDTSSGTLRISWAHAGGAQTKRCLKPICPICPAGASASPAAVLVRRPVAQPQGQLLGLLLQLVDLAGAGGCARGSRGEQQAVASLTGRQTKGAQASGAAPAERHRPGGCPEAVNPPCHWPPPRPTWLCMASILSWQSDHSRSLCPRMVVMTVVYRLRFGECRVGGRDTGRQAAKA